MTRVFALAVAMACIAGPIAAQTAYAVRSDGTDAFDDHLYAIDLATAVATPIGPTGFEDVESIAFDAGCDVLFGVDDETDQWLTCNLATGGCTAVGPLGVLVTDTGLAFTSATASFLSTDAPKNPSNAYALDPQTGQATLLGAQGQEVTAVAYTGGVLYGLGGDGQDNLVVMNGATGQATEIGPLGAVALADGGLDADANGVLWGVADGGSRSPSVLFTVDPVTGAATVVGTLHLDGGPDLVGFESLAIPGGACGELVLVPPSLDKAFAPATAPLGVAVRLTFAIHNPNQIPLTDVAFDDTFPPGLHVAEPPQIVDGCAFTAGLPAAGASGFAVSGGTVAAGGSCTFALDVVATAAGNFENTAGGVRSAEAPDGSASNTAILGVGSAPAIPTLSSVGAALAALSLAALAWRRLLGG